MTPFAGGLAAPPNAALLFSIAAALLYFLMLDQPPSWRRTAAKTLAVSLLAFIAWDQGGPMLLVAALLFSAAGDAFLAQNGERAFLAGLASFLLAHVLYVALFTSAGEGAFAFAAEPWRLAAALGVIASAGAMLHRLWPQLDPALRAPIILYVIAILLMGCSALTLPVPLVILGAALFILSDGILAAERFILPTGSPQRAWTSKAVWLLYYAAQLAITLGALRA